MPPPASSVATSLDEIDQVEVVVATADHHIRTGTADERILTRAAVQNVDARIAGNEVVGGVAGAVEISGARQSQVFEMIEQRIVAAREGVGDLDCVRSLIFDFCNVIAVT